MADIGYARVSKRVQNLDLQLDALTRAGCDPIYSDKLSGARDDRPRLTEALAATGPGDTFTVWRLDRAGRSLQHLLQIVDGLQRHDAAFRSLTESIDTSGAAGRLIFHVLAAIAEFERDLNRERTAAGLQAARDRGRVGGPAPYGIAPDHVTVIPGEAALLVEAAERILAREPAHQVVDDWHQRGLRTRKGGRWTITSLRGQLLNPKVAPILGDDVHQQLVRLFTSPDRRRVGRPGRHLLSAVLQCERCQQPMYGGHVTGDRWVYRCRRAKGSGGRFQGCGRVFISMPKADEWAEHAFIAAICGESSQLPNHITARLNELQGGGPSPAQLADEREELGELNIVLGTRYATPEHRARHAELAERARAAEARLRSLPDLSALSDLPQVESQLRAQWAAWTVPERRVWLKRVLDRVTVAPAPAGTHHRGSDVGARLDPKWKV